jgi:hypothetical protein
LLGAVKGVSAAANTLSEQLNKDVLLELKGIGGAMDNVAQAVEDLKQILTSSESKKGIFGWIKSK